MIVWLNFFFKPNYILCKRIYKKVTKRLKLNDENIVLHNSNPKKVAADTLVPYKIDFNNLKKKI